MKVFLTGGTGFIGHPLTAALLKRGWDITALVRDPHRPQAQALGKLGAQLIKGDVTDRESMRVAMTGADIVIHNAGQYEYGLNNAGKQRMHAVNIIGTENVLSLAHELHIPRVVYVSTVQIFGESGIQPRDETFTRQFPCRTEYERSKTDAHEIAIQYQRRGLPLVIACPNGVIGANDHSAWGYFLRLYINRIMPPAGWSPKTIHALAYKDDIAEGIALAAEKGRIGEMYIFSGEARPFREHTDYWLQRPGAFKTSIWLSTKTASMLFATMEPILRMLGLPAFMSSETAIGGGTNWYYTSEKAKRELGWSYRSAEEMWQTTIDDEIELLSKRRDQPWLQRVKPLDIS